MKLGIENDSGIEIEIFETLNRSQGGGKYTEQNLRNEEIAVEVDISSLQTSARYLVYDIVVCDKSNMIYASSGDSLLLRSEVAERREEEKERACGVSAGKRVLG